MGWSFDATALLGLALGWMMVAARVAGLLLTLPVLTNAAIPTFARAVLLIGLSAVVWVSIGMRSVALPGPLPVVGILVVREVAIGAALGFAVRLLLAAADAAGEVMGLSMGLAAAQLFDPSSGARASLPAHVLALTAALVLVSVGGLERVLAGVIHSFQAMPLGELPRLSGGTDGLMEAGAAVFRDGVRIAAPVLAMGFLVNVALALSARISPQINLFAVGFVVIVGVGVLLLPEQVAAVGQLVADTAETLSERVVDFAAGL